MKNSKLILSGRILLLSAAVAAVVVSFALGRANHVGDGGQSNAPTYACPMHPEVTGSSATGCPICGMALEPVRPRARVAAGVAETFSLPADGPNRQFFDVTFAKLRPVAWDMRAPAWIDSQGAGLAILFNDEVALLDDHEHGTFVVGTAAGDKDGVKVNFTKHPPSPWDSSTSAVRFEVDGGAGRDDRAQLAPGAVGWIKLAPRSRQVLSIPYSAVVQSPRGPYVLIAATDRRTFSKRPVKIGRVMFGYATVLGGVREGERVVAMNTFFMDSERRLRSRTEGAPEATP